MKRILPVIALVMVLTNGPAWAADATAALDFNSAYVWRGITFNNGLVAQPSLDVGKNGFGLNVWGNYDIDDYDDTLADYDFQEIDLTAYYTKDVGKFCFTAGIINYVYPSSGLPATTELYGSAAMAIIGGLSAGIDFYYDVDEVTSYYADLGLTYAMDLTEQLALETGAKIGYAGEGFAQYYSAGASDGGFYDYGLSLGLTYALSEALSIGAAVNYVGSLDSDVLPDADLDDGVYGIDSQVFGGVSMAYAF